MFTIHDQLRAGSIVVTVVHADRNDENLPRPVSLESCHEPTMTNFALSFCEMFCITQHGGKSASNPEGASLSASYAHASASLWDLLP
mmetsp:Transcript_40586/g.100798  ORF Transcript_40586/g.100798 Transcript_40586/m.100798 type:complete len:87 (-) Transcript_40586:914-1174(-)